MTTNRVLASILLVGGATLGALQLDHRVLAHWGQEVCCLVESPSLLHEEEERAVQLADLRQRNEDLMEEKSRLARELLSGRVTLRQAASRFEALSRQASYDWDYLAANHPEWSLESRCAHYVIDQVEYELLSDQKNPEEIVQRLQAEKDTW